MIVAVQGSKTFDDYSVFMRSMAVALSSLKGDDDDMTIYTVGPHKVSSFIAGFVNLSEDGLKARGKTIKRYSVSHRWVEDNINKIDYFVYLANPDEHMSRLARTAERSGCEVGMFRY